MNEKPQVMNESTNLLKEVLTTQYFAVLSTLDGKVPYLNLVSFTMVDDMKTLIFVTNRNTRKYHNILRNNAISLLVDNRTNQPSDISNAVAITLLGTANVDPDNSSGFKDFFLSRHPHLKQFVEDKEIALVLVTISEYIIAGFNNTQRLVIS